MFKLDDNLLRELGLGSLPVDEKNKMLAHIYETLEMRVGMRLAEQMTDQQLDEFEHFIDSNDEAGALKWLESNFPDYKQVVADELEKLKAEIRQHAPAIVEAARQEQAAQMAAAPIQPATQQAPQPNAQPMTPPAPAAPQQAYQPMPPTDVSPQSAQSGQAQAYDPYAPQPDYQVSQQHTPYQPSQSYAAPEPQIYQDPAQPMPPMQPMAQPMSQAPMPTQSQYQAPPMPPQPGPYQPPTAQP